ncbi:small nuclear ribonucleoprotein D3 [Fonticula alba]|uniref:Small nuclear ribonucleoprotein Sm D3 n=1 Tax=Fonticula alba TaxID=691883 RepID=A0A058Z8U5_FONAL|nr:small nuclear ribonucleoprotein D3 [Fonticula alba]KCV70690.1 small nuclear ribonucleoprotein D3 [Fonticula alba]|eukprot:XP_009495206.1 small nuclear ribonucleoprotein D3 [Fonticula alba]
MSLGIPVKLLHESCGHTITAELKTGEVYRGKLVDAEDNMNCQMVDVTFTARDGKTSRLRHVYIRGSHIRFFIVPDLLKHAPMFKRAGIKGNKVPSEEKPGSGKRPGSDAPGGPAKRANN